MKKQPAETTYEESADPEATSSDLLSHVLLSKAAAAPQSRREPVPHDLVVGTLTGLDGSGQPLVRVPVDRSAESRPARTTVVVSDADVGRDVALAFEAGDIRKPVILGLIQPPASKPPDETIRDAAQQVLPLQAEVDGQRLVLTADREIVLRCGQASITLTKAGKVLIRGAYLLSRSSGVNRIKGGSVQIN